MTQPDTSCSALKLNPKSREWIPAQPAKEESAKQNRMNSHKICEFTGGNHRDNVNSQAKDSQIVK